VVTARNPHVVARPLPTARTTRHDEVQRGSPVANRELIGQNLEVRSSLRGLVHDDAVEVVSGGGVVVR
jgi:hypothetical protein